MPDELLTRINQLAKKKRTEGLSPQELDEQKRLYQMYLTVMRQQVVKSLDNAGYKPPEKSN